MGRREVEMVMGWECIVERGGKRMGIRVEGKLGKGVRGKDVGVYMMWKMSRRGGRG